MQIVQISRIASTSGDAWHDILNVPCTVTSLTLANLSMGAAVVSVRLNKSGGATATIVPEDELPMGASARLRLPSVVLETGDKLQVKSVGLVDWVASAMTVTE